MLSNSIERSPSKRMEIFSDKLRLDCPSAACDGWLRVFGDTDGVPNYVRCSSEVDGVPPPSCSVRVMMSKFETVCPLCSQLIKKHAIIASPRSTNFWVHCKCYKADKAIFATCQRCHVAINSESEAASSTCGGTTGYCHTACLPKKKRQYDEYTTDQEDSQGTALSQETIISASAVATTKKTKRYP